MNGEEFYDLFKDALNFVGSGWRDKANVKIYIEANSMKVRYENLEVSIDIPKIKKENSDG